MQTDLRNAILVLGMHRSGTSALTRVLALHGLALPNTLMDAKPENPKGFWEAPEIAAFNDRLLASLGRSWDDPRAMPAEPPAPQIVEEARALLDHTLPSSGNFVLKDPRLCRLLPVWLPALGAFGATPLVVLAVRNPLEVAASLATRNAMAFPVAMDLWLAHVLDAERGTRGLPRIVVHFDDLLRNWRAAIAPGRHAFGLGPPLDTDIDDFLTASLRHEQSYTDSVLRHAEVPLAIKRVYAELRRSPVAASLDPEPFDRAAPPG